MLVSVTGVRGSAPRETGARMIVTARETRGTIGGGQLEYQCTRIAASHLREQAGVADDERFVRRFPLGSDCGQCCGGVVDVLFEPVSRDNGSWLDKALELRNERKALVIATSLNTEATLLICGDDCFSFGNDSAPESPLAEAARDMLSRAASAGAEFFVDPADAPYLMQVIGRSRFHVAVFGAGHVGSAVVDVLSRLDCDIRWIDSRRNVFPADLPPNATTVESAQPEREIAAMPQATCFLVMTHSHALDYEICQRILAGGDFSYCGLIGSLTKRRRFERLMRQQGMSVAALDRLTCPIGVSGISGKHPQEIAIAVAAELLQLVDSRYSRADLQAGDNVQAL